MLAPDPADLAPLSTVLPTGIHDLAVADDTPTAAHRDSSTTHADVQQHVTGAMPDITPAGDTKAPTPLAQTPLVKPRPPPAPAAGLQVVGRALPSLDRAQAGTEAPKRQKSSWDALWSTLHALEDAPDAAQSHDCE